MSSSSIHRHRTAAGAVSLLATALLALVGCATPDSESDLAAIERPLDVRHERVTDAQLRLEMMRFADDYGVELLAAIDEADLRVGDLRRKRALRAISLEIISALIGIATGPDAEINLLDMMVSTRVARLALEEYWIPEVLGPAGEPLLPVARLGEEEVWELSERVLTAEQQQQVRDLVDHWRGADPYRRSLLATRFSRFTSEFVAEQRDLALLLLDDVRGVTAEAREARLTAERTLFLLQRLPAQLQAQANLSLYDFLLLDDTRNVLASIERFGALADQLNTTLEGLPAELERQRSDALAEVFAGVDAQRSALLADLEQAEAPLSKLLAELRATVEAGNQLAERADRLSARFVPEGGPADDAEPFDIGEYRDTAVEVAQTAAQLEQLVASLERLAGGPGGEPDGPLFAALDRATNALDDRIDYAFWRGVALILIAGATALAVALAYRRLAPRMS